MIGFSETALREYQEWAVQDKKVFAKINKLINGIQRDPFRGEGKPEPLKGNLSGYWSRRITGEHRLLYKISPDYIFIASCKYHY